ncbi:hypothetical protein [Maricaulis sp. CAU 1757]
MQLKIRRSQKTGLTGKVVFQLDVMAELTPDEKALVQQYKLGKELVYSSEAADRNAEMARAGSLKALGGMVLDRATKRRFTMNDLINGQHLECKDLGELTDTEEQVHVACHNIRRYLEVAKSFDGTEHILEIEPTAP